MWRALHVLAATLDPAGCRGEQCFVAAARIERQVETPLGTAPARWQPRGRTLWLCVMMLVSACGGGSATAIPAASPATPGASMTRVPVSWPSAFEIYTCSALDELALLTPVTDRMIDDLDGGTAVVGPDGSREIEEPLQTVRDYVDQIPEWEPGTRLRDLLLAAVNHYEEGAAAIRSATPADTAMIAEASDALSRGSDSVRKTGAAQSQLEAATGFSC